MGEERRDARARTWLVGAVLLFAGFVAVANVVDVLAHLVPGSHHVTVSADRMGKVPVAYHPQCADAPLTLSARFGRWVDRVLPARRGSSETSTLRCHRCGKPIENGAEMVLVSR